MSTRTLISLAASVLITGAFVFGLTTAPRPAAIPQPSTIDGLPVTNLPGMTVRPPAQAASAEPVHDDIDTVAVSDGGRTLLHELTVQVASPHLRMPYYSFASASLQIGKD